MAVYIDEEDAWKCPNHPTRRRRTGICHVCLRDRLSSLCPDCANVRPCACCTTTSSSSSSSSSFSRFRTTKTTAVFGDSLLEAEASGIGAVGRVSNLIESEPAFRRSRSLAIPFLRSKPDCNSVHKESPKTSSFWSRLKSSGGNSVNKSKRGGGGGDHVERKGGGAAVEEEVVEEDVLMKKNIEEEERRRMMRKSRSVAVTSSDSGIKSSKGKSWYFASPIKAFKQSISRGIIVHERSPLYRG